MRAAFALSVLVLLTGASNQPTPSAPASSNQQQEKTGASDGKTDGDKRDPPTVIVNVGTSPPNQLHANGESKREEHGAATEWWIAGATVALAIITGILAYFTFGLWSATIELSREAKVTGDGHAEKMERSVGEAVRSASAMEAVAEATRNNAALMQKMLHKQMRAYLIVEIGVGVYQDETKRFDVRPSLTNVGLTPANNMHYWARAAILPFPSPDGHHFPAPIGESTRHGMVIGPRQGIQLNAVVDDRIPPDDVEVVKRGKGRRVYIWGVVTYTDIFDEIERTTEFCQSIHWVKMPDGSETIYGTYDFNHNKAT